MDKLAKTTRDALADLLVARVEAERDPAHLRGALDLVEAGRELTGNKVADDARRFLSTGAEERERLIADLDEALEHTARALARARACPVIPLQVPHVARAAA